MSKDREAQLSSEGTQSSSKKALPIDRGWAWVVLMACTVEFFILVGYIKCFGLFFVEYLKRYNTSASVISSVLSLQTVVVSITSVFVMGIGTRIFHERTLILIGGILCSAAFIGNAFAPTAIFLMFSQGILFGSSVSLFHLPITLMLSLYFKKRRGFANSIANVGGSIGGLVFPPMLRFFFDYFGLQGALIIVSAIFLHILVIGSLMRPIKVPENEHDNNLKSNGTYEKSKSSQELEIVTYTQSNGDRKVSKSSYEIFKPVKFTNRRRTQSETAPETSTTRVVNSRSLHSLKSDAYGSLGNIASSIGVISAEISEKPDVEVQEQKNCCIQFVNSLFDYSLFKNPLFDLFLLSSFFVAPGCGLPPAFIPPLAEDCHLSKDNVAILVTISNGSDLVGRVLLTFIADNQKIKRHQIVMTSLIINGTFCMFVPFYTSFNTLTIIAVTYGIFGGVYFSLFPVVIVDFVGLPNLKYGLAMNTVLTGLSSAVASAVIGSIRDYTGSYIGPFFLMGGCSLLAGLILMLEPLARKCNNKRLERMKPQPDVT